MYRRIAYLSILCGVLLSAAVASAAEPPRSARVVTSSEDLYLTKEDHAVCLDRRQDPHAMIVLLPTDAELDQEFVIDDCSENSASFHITALQPEGHTMTGPRIMAANGETLRVRYFGKGIWRAEP
jgi:hypothetical protein